MESLMNRITFIIGSLLLSLITSASFGYTESDNEGPNIARHAESLLIAQKFDVLEKLATEYRTNNTRIRGGVPALYFFYPGLSSHASKDLFVSSITDQDRETLLQEWQRKLPQSTTARIALSDFWMKLGWQARGGGFASSVTDAGWQTFHEYVTKALSVLREVDLEKDPMAYHQQIELAKDSSAHLELLQSLYLKAISKFPDFYEFYIQRAILLQEKWYGKPGEFIDYANSLLKISDREIGVIAYSFVVVNTINSCDCNSNEIFRSIGFSWPPTKQGFYARLRKYGLRNRDWNQLTLLASLAGRPEDAKAALDHITEWDPPIWKSRENYDRAVAWINASQPHADTAPQPASTR
jgi:hypothetical protein